MATIAEGSLSTTTKTERSLPSTKLGRRVRIARVITRLNVGGPAVHVVQTTKRLGQLGFKTTVITGSLAPGERSADELIAELDESPIFIEELGRDPSLKKDVITLVRLIRIFRQTRPDIVHTHLSKAGALGRVAAWMAGVPIRVHTYHGLVFAEHFSQKRSGFYAWIERVLARLSTRLVAISPKQKADVETRFRIAGAEKVECIPLGLDLEPYLSRRAPSLMLRRELGLSPKHELVGWIGRLVPIKDPLLLVDVARRVVDEIPSCHFVVVGDGVLRDVLEAAIRPAGLIGNIHLIGWRTDLPDIYSDMNLLLLTSKNEGTPLTLLEGMASGKTFVAPEVGGIPDLAGGACEMESGTKFFENAALCTRSAEALANATIRLLRDDRLRKDMGDKAREFVTARYSASRLAEDLANLYANLLEESSAGAAGGTGREV